MGKRQNALLGRFQPHDMVGACRACVRVWSGSCDILLSIKWDQHGLGWGNKPRKACYMYVLVHKFWLALLGAQNLFALTHPPPSRGKGWSHLVSHGKGGNISTGWSRCSLQTQLTEKAFLSPDRFIALETFIKKLRKAFFSVVLKEKTFLPSSPQWRAGGFPTPDADFKIRASGEHSHLIGLLGLISHSLGTQIFTQIIWEQYSSQQVCKSQWWVYATSGSARLCLEKILMAHNYHY